MSKPGPKPVLDDVKQAEIFAALAQGASRRAAARYVGCSHNTIANTAKRDAGFAERLRKAEMQRELDALSQINASFGKSWRAAAWYLERTRPQDYEKVQLRQPTFDQISDFWDECAGIVLQGVPVEHRGPVERRLEKASRRFAGRFRLPGGTCHPIATQPPGPARRAGPTEGAQLPTDGWLGMTTGKPQRVGVSASLLPQPPSDGEPEFDAAAAAEAIQSFDRHERQRKKTLGRKLATRYELRRQEMEIEAIRGWREAYFNPPPAEDDVEPDWIEQLRDAEIPAGHPAYEEFSRPLDAAVESEKECESVEGWEGEKECDGVKARDRGAGILGAAALLAILLTCGALLASAPLSRGVYPRATAVETTLTASHAAHAASVRPPLPVLRERAGVRAGGVGSARVPGVEAQRSPPLRYNEVLQSHRELCAGFTILDPRSSAQRMDLGSTHPASARAKMDSPRAIPSAGINPAAHSREIDPARPTPSPGTPGEGWGEGLACRFRLRHLVAAPTPGPARQAGPTAKRTGEC